jgi:hypothetical protein
VSDHSSTNGSLFNLTDTSKWEHGYYLILMSMQLHLHGMGVR